MFDVTYSPHCEPHTDIVTMCPASDNCNDSTNLCIKLKCAHYIGPFPASFQYRTTGVQTLMLASCLRLVRAVSGQGCSVDLFLALKLANPMSQTFSAERGQNGSHTTAEHLEKVTLFGLGTFCGRLFQLQGCLVPFYQSVHSPRCSPLRTEKRLSTSCSYRKRIHTDI